VRIPALQPWTWPPRRRPTCARRDAGLHTRDGYAPRTYRALALKWTVALVLRKRKCRIVRSLSPLHGQLPAIAIEIVKPDTHMGGAGCFGTDLVVRVFQINIMLFEMI
jgi:hypothetical protein